MGNGICVNFPQYCKDCVLNTDGECGGVIRINNLLIKCYYTPYNEEKFAVYTPNGSCWEDRLSFFEAIDYCFETKDFVTE